MVIQPNGMRLAAREGMDVDRARVVIVIRAIRDAVLADRAIGPPQSVRVVDPLGCEIVRRACAEHAITLDSMSMFVAVCAADPRGPPPPGGPQGRMPSSSSAAPSSAVSRYTRYAPASSSSSCPYPPESNPTPNIRARRAASRSHTESPTT